MMWLMAFSFIKSVRLYPLNYPKPALAGPGKVVYVLYDEGSPVYMYAYPSKSSISITTEDSASGSSAVHIILDPADYSGAAIGFRPVDLRKYRWDGSLEFWVKGKGSRFSVALLDSEDDGKKVEISVPVEVKGMDEFNWHVVRVPLADFPDWGGWWDGARLNSAKFDWSKVAEVKVMIVPTLAPGGFDILIDRVVIRNKSGRKGPSIRELYSKPEEVIRTDRSNNGVYLGVFREGAPSSIKLIEDLSFRWAKKLRWSFSSRAGHILFR